MQEIIKMTDDELRNNLITCDYRGKEFKEKVLAEILRRNQGKDTELLNWIQHSPNPRFQLVVNEWRRSEVVHITIRSAIEAAMRKNPDAGFEIKYHED